MGDYTNFTLLLMSKFYIVCALLFICIEARAQVTMVLDALKGRKVHVTIINQDNRSYQLMPVFDIFSALDDTTPCRDYGKWAAIDFGCLGPDTFLFDFERYGGAESVKSVFDIVRPSPYKYKHCAKKDMGLFLQLRKNKAVILPAAGSLRVVITLPRFFTKKRIYRCIDNKRQIVIDKSLASQCYFRLAYRNSLKRDEIEKVSVSADSIYTGCIMSQNILPIKLR